MQHATHGTHSSGKQLAQKPYRRLFAMVVMSFFSMYVLMYAMVDVAGNVFNNVNQLYMAGLMTAPMLLLELLLMSAMYPNKLLNMGIGAATALAFAMLWSGIRLQAGVSDQQFVRSMVPHHAGAILMCKRNRLHDPELRQLCQEIIRSQQAEIDLMRRKLQ